MARKQKNKQDKKANTVINTQENQRPNSAALNSEVVSASPVSSSKSTSRAPSPTPPNPVILVWEAGENNDALEAEYGDSNAKFHALGLWNAKHAVYFLNAAQMILFNNIGIKKVKNFRQLNLAFTDEFCGESLRVFGIEGIEAAIKEYFNDANSKVAINAINSICNAENIASYDALEAYVVESIESAADMAPQEAGPGFFASAWSYAGSWFSNWISNQNKSSQKDEVPNPNMNNNNNNPAEGSSPQVNLKSDSDNADLNAKRSTLEETDESKQPAPKVEPNETVDRPKPEMRTEAGWIKKYEKEHQQAVKEFERQYKELRSNILAISGEDIDYSNLTQFGEYRRLQSALREAKFSFVTNLEHGRHKISQQDFEVPHDESIKLVNNIASDFEKHHQSIEAVWNLVKKEYDILEQAENCIQEAKELEKLKITVNTTSIQEKIKTWKDAVGAHAVRRDKEAVGEDAFVAAKDAVGAAIDAYKTAKEAAIKRATSKEALIGSCTKPQVVRDIKRAKRLLKDLKSEYARARKAQLLGYTYDRKQEKSDVKRDKNAKIASISASWASASHQAITNEDIQRLDRGITFLQVGIDALEKNIKSNNSDAISAATRAYKNLFVGYGKLNLLSPEAVPAPGDVITAMPLIKDEEDESIDKKDIVELGIYQQVAAQYAEYQNKQYTSNSWVAQAVYGVVTGASYMPSLLSGAAHVMGAPFSYAATYIVGFNVARNKILDVLNEVSLKQSPSFKDMIEIEKQIIKIWHHNCRSVDWNKTSLKNDANVFLGGEVRELSPMEQTQFVSDLRAMGLISLADYMESINLEREPIKTLQGVAQEEMLTHRPVQVIKQHLEKEIHNPALAMTTKVQAAIKANPTRFTFDKNRKEVNTNLQGVIENYEQLNAVYRDYESRLAKIAKVQSDFANAANTNTLSQAAQNKAMQSLGNLKSDADVLKKCLGEVGEKINSLAGKKEASNEEIARITAEITGLQTTLANKKDAFNTASTKLRSHLVDAAEKELYQARSNLDVAQQKLVAEQANLAHLKEQHKQCTAIQSNIEKAQLAIDNWTSFVNSIEGGIYGKQAVEVLGNMQACLEMKTEAVAQFQLMEAEMKAAEAERLYGEEYQKDNASQLEGIETRLKNSLQAWSPYALAGGALRNDTAGPNTHNVNRKSETLSHLIDDIQAVSHQIQALEANKSKNAQEIANLKARRRRNVAAMARVLTSAYGLSHHEGDEFDMRSKGFNAESKQEVIEGFRFAIMQPIEGMNVYINPKAYNNSTNKEDQKHLNNWKSILEATELKSGNTEEVIKSTKSLRQCFCATEELNVDKELQNVFENAMSQAIDEVTAYYAKNAGQKPRATVEEPLRFNYLVDAGSLAQFDREYNAFLDECAAVSWNNLQKSGTDSVKEVDESLIGLMKEWHDHRKKLIEGLVQELGEKPAADVIAHYKFNRNVMLQSQYVYVGQEGHVGAVSIYKDGKYDKAVLSFGQRMQHMFYIMNKYMHRMASIALRVLTLSKSFLHEEKFNNSKVVHQLVQGDRDAHIKDSKPLYNRGSEHHGVLVFRASMLTSGKSNDAAPEKTNPTPHK